MSCFFRPFQLLQTSNSYLRLNVTSVLVWRRTVQWVELKRRSRASRLPKMFTTSHGCEFADRRVKRSTNHSRLGFLGGGPQSDMIQKQNVFETCWSGLAEMNSLRIIRATKTVFHVANTYSKYTSLFYFLRIFIHCNTQTQTHTHTHAHTR